MTTGVLAMSYGTPSDPTDILRFYTDIRGGRAPNDEQLRLLVDRYEAIGGVSPLNARTAAQLGALIDALEQISPGRYLGSSGSKHSAPTIEKAIETLASQGVDDLVGVVLAPHYSSLSVGEYIERARDVAHSIGLPARFIERWGEEPVLIELLTARVAGAVTTLRAQKARQITVLFTAHSLPARILDVGDPYVDEVTTTAKRIAEAASLSHFEVAWQSAAKTPEPWIGPELLSVIDRLADDGVDAVVVCPVGFTSDHLEILFDLDIEAAAHARSRGICFVRTPSLNDDRRLFHALALRINELALTEFNDERL